jgi:hypothetical protein
VRWTLNFTAPGDDWNYGTAAAYDVRCSSTPITQSNFYQATPVDLGGVKPSPGGTKESISITPSPGAKYCAVRAIDKAGNIGPIPLAAATTNGGIPAGTTPIPAGTTPGGSGLPNTATGDQGAAGAILLLVLVAAIGWRSRAALRGSFRRAVR